MESSFAIGAAREGRVFVYRGLQRVASLRLPVKFPKYVREGKEFSSFGAYLGAGYDFDGDAVQDILVSDYDASEERREFPLGSDGVVMVFSGSNFRLLKAYAPKRMGLRKSGYGIGDTAPLSFIGDITGDAVPEVIISFRVEQRSLLLNGATGKIIRSLKLEATDTEEGESECSPDFTLAQLADLDGDGVQDFAMRSTSLNKFLSHRVKVFSGATGALLTNLGPYACVAPAGDFDDDGFPDLLLSQPFDSTGVEDAPSNGFRVISGSDFSTLLEVAP
jgi:hypothetical protein